MVLRFLLVFGREFPSAQEELILHLLWRLLTLRCLSKYWNPLEFFFPGPCGRIAYRE